MKNNNIDRKIFFSFILLICILAAGFTGIIQSENKESHRRGIVVLPSDVISLGSETLADIISESGLNLLGIHANTISPDPSGNGFEDISALKRFLESREGRSLMKECKRKNIDVEYETHALEEILPRDLFDKHPEYFRMDKNGDRQKHLNMCFHSEGAYSEIEKSLKEILVWMKPTTHRYFFWTDDNVNAFCQCNLCRKYSETEQALIYENRLLSILRKIDSTATVAHLAYHNTLKAPVKVKPEDGIFLEFAPISRNYSKPLSADQVADLKDNLKVFSASTAHILEYWLDASMHSDWDRDNLTRVPWLMQNCDRDLDFYRGLGITSATCFGTWMLNRNYFEKFGEENVLKAMKEYGSVLMNYLPDKH